MIVFLAALAQLNVLLVVFPKVTASTLSMQMIAYPAVLVQVFVLLAHPARHNNLIINKKRLFMQPFFYALSYITFLISYSMFISIYPR